MTPMGGSLSHLTVSMMLPNILHLPEVCVTLSYLTAVCVTLPQLTAVCGTLPQLTSLSVCDISIWWSYNVAYMYVIGGWCVVRGGWWCVTCGEWSIMVGGVWCMTRSKWCLMYGVWRVTGAGWRCFLFVCFCLQGTTEWHCPCADCSVRQGAVMRGFTGLRAPGGGAVNPARAAPLG